MPEKEKTTVTSVKRPNTIRRVNQNSLPHPLEESQPTSTIDSVSTPIASPLTLDSFELGSSLGSGKFGHVYLARHLPSNYICALKALPKTPSTNDALLIRRELEVHQNLAHPHILRLLAWFHDAENIYLVLEYAAGGNLFSVLKKQPGGRLEERVAAGYIAQVASALRYMHTKNVVHRDLKPENILLGLHGEIKLADFGYSVHSYSGLRRTICGTLDYLSPEVAGMLGGKRREDVYAAKAVDRWCLGVLVYEVLVGRAPFEMREREETRERIEGWDGEGLRVPEWVSKEAEEMVRGVSWFSLCFVCCFFCVLQGLLL